MIAYGVMSLVMTATPIAMLDCGHDFAAAAFVIQWHSLGMFAPRRTAMGEMRRQPILPPPLVNFRTGS
jgi:hypothetical protein